jgi:hypothetical protein
MNKIEFTRINNDINGNPRYVCHYLNLIVPGDYPKLHGATDEEQKAYDDVMSRTEYLYAKAVKRANKIGGRKYHNKQYGGGIVFQSYNITATEMQINELLNESK